MVTLGDRSWISLRGPLCAGEALVSTPFFPSVVNTGPEKGCCPKVVGLYGQAFCILHITVILVKETVFLCH